MSRKEKKGALKKAKFEAEVEQLSQGSQFAVSQQDQSTKGALMENATDIKVLTYVRFKQSHSGCTLIMSMRYEQILIIFTFVCRLKVSAYLQGVKICL